MSKISGTNTKPEKIVRKFLFSKGFRYRKNSKSLPGKPDIVLSKYGTVIFVHGCFWHGHRKCKSAKLPETRKAFWKNKIESNKMRDSINSKELRKQGWNVITIWQCQLKNNSKQEKTLTSLLNKLVK
jgi:DNA mismatch endonuclease (patch repair protein)